MSAGVKSDTSTFEQSLLALTAKAGGYIPDLMRRVRQWTFVIQKGLQPHIPSIILSFISQFLIPGVACKMTYVPFICKRNGYNIVTYHGTYSCRKTKKCSKEVIL